MIFKKANFSLFIEGTVDSIPLVLAAIPFGLIFGAISISSGLSAWATMSMSLFVFAGASQFISIKLLASSSSITVILMTVFLVNLRHMIYAANLMPQVSTLPQKLRILMAFWLTDETFAVVSSRVANNNKNKGIHWYYLGSACAMYFMWSTCTLIGIILGKQIPEIADWGLDVAMILGFVGIVVPNLKCSIDWTCATTAIFGTLLTHNWPNQTGLLFSSFLAITVSLIADIVINKKISEKKNE